MSRFGYTSPTSVTTALQDLATIEGSRLLAGGTDLLREIRSGSARPAALVSLKNAEGLSEIKVQSDGGLKIGARVTLAGIAAHPVIRERYTALAEAAGGAATPQLRNVATVAGNLLQRPNCEYYRGDFPCLLKGGTGCPARDGDNTHHALFGHEACASGHPSDLAAALLAFNARVTWKGPEGESTAGLSALYRVPDAGHPGEIALDRRTVITAVHLSPFTGRSTYLQARERRTWAFALIGVAARLTTLNGRVHEAGLALTGAAPIPWRLAEVEKILAGRTLGESAAWAVEAGRLAVRDAAPLRHNAYKVRLVEGLVTRALRRLSQAE